MDMTDEMCLLGAAARARAGDMGSEMERCASDRHASCSLSAKAGSTVRRCASSVCIASRRMHERDACVSAWRLAWGSRPPID